MDIPLEGKIYTEQEIQEIITECKKLNITSNLSYIRWNIYDKNISFEEGMKQFQQYIIKPEIFYCDYRCNDDFIEAFVLKEPSVNK